jgi:hypothetical protein
VQFLLGPDRKHLLSPEILFLRWSVVQLAGVLVIAVGARVAQPVLGWRTRRRALVADLSLIQGALTSASTNGRRISF